MINLKLDQPNKLFSALLEINYLLCFACCNFNMQEVFFRLRLSFKKCKGFNNAHQ